MESDVKLMARQAKAAAAVLAGEPLCVKNDALSAMARLLDENRLEIVSRNKEDLDAATVSGVEKRLVDRLVFADDRINARIMALEAIIALEDPVGGTSEMIRMPGGLLVGRMRVPMGVVAVVYESRPHVTVNAGALCVKSGNAAVLRGGSEVIRTNRFLAELWALALEEAGLPEGCVQVVGVTDRAAVRELLELDEYIDLVIPRGGEGLIRTVMDISRIPVIKHLYGICHVYVDGGADLEMASRICLDSKVFAPEVCNAAETFLVAESIAERLLPDLCGKLETNGVEVRGCQRTVEILPEVGEATEEDWSTEYLDLVVSVRVVGGVDDAVEHINSYGSGHTESIVSGDLESIKRFLGGADSGVLLVNASTMYNDGSELGMGAEIGISTDKVHARGPVGVNELTTYKTVVFGSGNCMGEGS